MAHPEQQTFVWQMRERFPSAFRKKRVLEVGSRNVNGTVREFFTKCDYVGIDCTDGPGVDVVTLAHQYDDAALFDTVISCEAFEHDPYLPQTIERIGGLLRMGGLFIATWASPLRLEHGTINRNRGELFGPDPTYYRGVGPNEFRGIAAPFLNPLVVKLTRMGLDCYAWGRRG